MAKNWVITSYHYDNRDAFEQAWNYDRSNGVIGIGWNLGDLSNLSSEEIGRRYAAVFSDRTKAGLNQVIRFWREIQPGDRVIARGGRKKIVGVGTVNGSPFHDRRGGIERLGGLDDWPYENFLPVRWEAVEKEFPDQVFGMLTVYELPDDRFEELVGRVNTPSPEESGSPSHFMLEKHLEEFIVSNFDAVFGSKLSLFVDEDNRKGRQYPTDVGVIDILAKDTADGSYLVIELKRGQTSDETVGQVLRYMGWVDEHLCAEQQEVRGLIICQDGDERLYRALRMVPNVSAKFYKVDFRLADTPGGLAR